MAKLSKPRNRTTRDLTGKVFGHWTALVRVKRLITAGHRSFRRTDWKCRCACGTIKIIRAASLTAGMNKSCGCRRGTHGMATGSRKHPMYLAWQNMRTRCGNPNRPQWKDYGGRGISVCPEWGTFSAFASDMGDSWSPGLTLDRKDNDADYSKENCKWSTKAEQQRNKVGTTWIQTPAGRMCIEEAARKYASVSAATVRYRLSAGWPEKLALLRPAIPAGKRQFGLITR